MPEGIPNGIGTAFIRRDTIQRSDDDPPDAYAPIVRDWQTKVADQVPDPGAQWYANDDWRTEHHGMDQLIKLGMQQTVGQQYVLVGVRRGPRVTFLVTNPWVPSRENKVGEYSQEDPVGRIGDARYMDQIPNTAIRRDKRYGSY
jgi:hypothetical protein